MKLCCGFASQLIRHSWSVLTLNCSNMARLSTVGATPNAGDANAVFAKQSKPVQSSAVALAVSEALGWSTCQEGIKSAESIEARV